jgi:hypothetical protein
VAAAAGVNDALRFRSAPAPDGRSPPGACGS